jgi:ABC-type Zn2+ transport system substrate-binding protein/surface adhesin
MEHKEKEDHEHAHDHAHEHKPYAVWLVIAILIICSVVPAILLFLSIPKLP